MWTPPKIPLLQPPWWARGGHGQTLWGHLLPCGAPRLTDRHELSLPDGDRLVLFCRDGSSSTVIYLFHGLSGDSDADYIRRTAAALPDDIIVAMNHRGCGAGRGLARGPYHSGSSEDLAATIRWGRDRHPDKAHVAIGFSLSGNALLLLEDGPDAVVAVNPPIDLARCSDAISTGFNRIYDIRFVLDCMRDPRSSGIRPWHTLREVDERYTAPAGGFRDADDYYATCSAKPRLRACDRPTVILTAADDPFVPVDSFHDLPVHTHIEPVGGHMGYVDKSGRWLDRALRAYVDSFRGTSA
ncbi:MAG: YheT family hydrolase [Planctomycetota bacterium]